jgi:hypothetical protein
MVSLRSPADPPTLSLILRKKRWTVNKSIYIHYKFERDILLKRHITDRWGRGVILSCLFILAF